MPVFSFNKISYENKVITHENKQISAVMSALDSNIAVMAHMWRKYNFWDNIVPIPHSSNAYMYTTVQR